MKTAFPSPTMRTPKNWGIEQMIALPNFNQSVVTNTIARTKKVASICSQSHCHARTTGMFFQLVVYSGVRRSCFVVQGLVSAPARVLEIMIVPRPNRPLT